MFRIMADNPGQFVLIGSGSIVLAKMMMRAVRPRNLVEALATALVADVLCIYGAKYLVEHKILRFRVRDDHGRLVLLEFGGDDDQDPAPRA